MIQKVVNSPRGEDVVRIVLLDETVEEQRQVVMVIKLLDFHLMHMLPHTYRLTIFLLTKFILSCVTASPKSN